MSSSDLALSIKGLSKAYTIAHGGLKRPTFREAIINRARHPFKKSNYETFWALKDININVNKGDVVGIIGRNGAGKSTLLKILSRITEPTAGEIDIYGRVGSLLEVGTGFHPELTGRENIYLNGAILGMHRPEIRKHFDEIVDFAGVEKFLDTPVKRYSSGMYVRLAFAVAAHLNSEILIIDEVLAVGDAEFQKKCLGKMKDVSGRGRTVLVVSHNMAVIVAICKSAVILHNGEAVFSGASQESVNRYLHRIEESAKNAVEERIDRRGKGDVRFLSCSVRRQGVGNAPCGVGSPFEISFDVNRWLKGMTLSFTIYDHRGQAIANFGTQAATVRDDDFVASDSRKEIIWQCSDCLLVPGNYYANAAISDGNVLQDHLEGIVAFEVEGGMLNGRAVMEGNQHGSVTFPCNWRFQ